MEKKYKFLALTDHSSHNETNSLYPLVRQIAVHHQCEQIDLATRANQDNHGLFFEMNDTSLSVIHGTKDFFYQEDGSQFDVPHRKVEIRDYDVILMRLPRPTSDQFLEYVDELLEDKVIINRPKGILETSNKAFLMNFPALCPPMRLCYSVDEIMEFASSFPIVIKPLRGYGGAGILKIDGDQLFDREMNFPAWAYLDFLSERIEEHGYLAMKFLKNVTEGDKRILVVNGLALAASLRLPPEGSWLCNVALGGKSVSAEVEESEMDMIKTLNPHLLEKGIFIYGLDTLQDDNGKRILSEINTLSVGGFTNAAEQNAAPILPQTIENLMTYVNQKYT